MAFTAAHRGLSADYAENTVPAFRAAARAGFPCVELDVRLTADNEVVVLHDAGIERTTDGNGRVADMKYDELRTYDTGEGPVPRLDDLLGELGDWFGMWNIEVKAHAAAKPALDLMAHHGLLERMQLSAMDPRALIAAQKAYPQVPRGLIVLGPPDVDDLELAQETACRWINVDHEFLGPQMFTKLHDAGLQVGAWTVNDPDRAKELVEMGVTCIITDTTDVLAVVPGSAAF